MLYLQSIQLKQSRIAAGLLLNKVKYLKSTLGSSPVRIKQRVVEQLENK